MIPRVGHEQSLGKAHGVSRIAMGISDMADMGQEKGLVRRPVRCVIKRFLPLGR
jgi:hypothetical protein